MKPTAQAKQAPSEEKKVQRISTRGNILQPLQKTAPFKHTPEELQKLIDEYFISGGNIKEAIIGSGSNKQIKKITIYTLTGLVLFCGFSDKTDMFNLERNPSYKRIIKKARTRIERIYEETLQTTGQSAAIFALKNFGWVDKQEIITEERTIKLDF